MATSSATKFRPICRLHTALVPVLLGEGIRLFENIGTEQIELEKISVIDDPGITHFRFRVVK